MERTSYQQAMLAVKNPARVALAICQDSRNRANLITLEWFMKTSIQPPMLAISIGHTRYSYECLQNFRYFNLCYPSREMAKAAVICGSVSGRDQDKLEITGLEWFPGRLARLPILSQAVANFECRTVTQVRSGDHTVFVGEVKYSWSCSGREPLLFSDLKF